MDPIDYYSRSEILDELVKQAQDREVQIWFGKIPGRRPETISYKNDLIDSIKRGMTSIHISLERWKDPTILTPGMKKRDLDELRLGWDLLLDIDAKNFELSRFTGKLLLDALKFHDVKDFKIKFSGNKGVHIIVPFESFPSEVNGINIKNYFPDGLRTIAEYLKSMIKEHLAVAILKKYSLDTLANEINIKKEELCDEKCQNCNLILKKATEEKFSFICKKCYSTTESNREEVICSICFIQMTKRIKPKKEEIKKCPDCRTTDKKLEFNPYSIVDIDSVLISSRHLFRACYSFNEKSGLVSIPIKDLDNFKKEDAKPELVKVTESFIDRENVTFGSAKQLLVQALDWQRKQSIIIVKKEENKNQEKQYEELKEEIPESMFPPCIQQLLLGCKEDGRKRAVFILINFLRNMGWDYNKIESRLKEWNEKNYEQLREGYIQTQINWAKKQGTSILPPNCMNKSYYSAMGIKCSETICNSVKNPVNYGLRMNKMKNETKGKRQSKKE